MCWDDVERSRGGVSKTSMGGVNPPAVVLDRLLSYPDVRNLSGCLLPFRVLAGVEGRVVAHLDRNCASG